ncbi:hypothetical protein ANCCAN_28109 [Ancylostoma caninum]|uniref:Uncharacterized protein n=1 Tax=Ancylostoma caninum TaxID=29170 RepID=A0A368F598_ANCCA|nr:hypothetical protein ANCCAN_28109 [Ancylostoma caninum]
MYGLSTYLQGKVPEAHEMLSRVTMSPAIIRRSLLVNVLVNEGRIDDALDEVEGCLQEDDVIFNSENSCISDEAVRIYSEFVFTLNTIEFNVYKATHRGWHIIL